ncbi:hypothetical protein EON65_16080 [archaeon]|nr:MAG: hypothetical protein EON65_16080 [archaeon]
MKKRMQAASSVLTSGLSPTSPLSLVQCVKGVYHAEGVRGFYRGLLPTMLKSVAATAITFAAFEVCIRCTVCEHLWSSFYNVSLVFLFCFTVR